MAGGKVAEADRADGDAHPAAGGGDVVKHLLVGTVAWCAAWAALTAGPLAAGRVVAVAAAACAVVDVWRGSEP